MQPMLTLGRFALGAALMLSLSGCGGSDRDPQLMNLRSQTRGPDEFSVLPTKALQMPENLTELPQPTPGGANITDPTPQADAVAALGGNPASLGQETPSASNAGLLNYTGRYGRSAGIRQTLAAEDLDWRRKNDGRLLQRIFNTNVYYRAYAPMSLDQYAELEYWRARGVRNVGAPPESVAAKRK
ncbi:MAG: DUF3035 domain-containing protein [Proteobacteria bacterium]|nr:DUF3035 domain-containing protein [Pseudomonadota bacterium]